MTFRDWIGYTKGEDPGVNIALKNFNKCNHTMIADLRCRNTQRNLSSVQEYLSALVYPEKFKYNGQSLGDAFKRKYIELYNKIADRGLAKLFDIGDSGWYHQTGSTVSVAKAGNENSARNNMSLNNYAKIRSGIDAFAVQIAKDPSNLTNNQLLEQLIAARQNLENNLLEYAEHLDGETTGRNSKTLSTLVNQGEGKADESIEKWLKNNMSERYGIMLLSKQTFKRGSIKHSQWSQIQASIQDLDTLYSQLRFLGGMSTTDIGNVWEYFLALTSDDFLKNVDSMAEDKIKDLITEQLDKRRVGQKHVSGDGMNFNIDVSSLNYDNSTYKSGTRVNDEGRTVATGTIGDITYDYQGFIDTGSSRQGKLDVTFNPKFTNTPLKMSAKNWSSLFEYENGITSGRKIGVTSLLGAVSRTAASASSNGRDILEQYLYALQTPKYADFRTGIYRYAHRFAKMCILLDTIHGYSQSYNNADTLTILDRSRRRVFLIDITGILLGMIEKGLAFFDDSNSIFYVDGYDGDSLVKDAISVRSAIRNAEALTLAQNRAAQAGRSTAYINNLIQYTHSIQVMSRLNSTLINTKYANGGAIE